MFGDLPESELFTAVNAASNPRPELSSYVTKLNQSEEPVDMTPRGGRQVTTEFHQQGTRGRRAVVNNQIVVVLLCVEVGTHHLDRVAIWHCDAPATVLVVGVIVRVVRAPKSTRVLATDGSWTTCGQCICASARGITNRSISLNCRMTS